LVLITVTPSAQDTKAPRFLEEAKRPERHPGEIFGAAVSKQLLRCAREEESGEFEQEAGVGPLDTALQRFAHGSEGRRVLPEAASSRVHRVAHDVMFGGVARPAGAGWEMRTLRNVT
jgi:hypothetical protein